MSMTGYNSSARQKRSAESTFNIRYVFIFLLSSLLIDLNAAESKCSPPVIPLNAIVTTRWDGNVVQFQCKPGYTLIGSTTAMCINNAWNHPPPICQLVQSTHRHTARNAIKNSGQRQQQSNHSTQSQYSILRSLSDLQYQHDYNMPTTNQWGGPKLGRNFNRPLFSWDSAVGVQHSTAVETTSSNRKTHLESQLVTPNERYAPTSMQLATKPATSSIPTSLHYSDRHKQSFAPPETRSAVLRKNSGKTRKRKVKGRNPTAPRSPNAKEVITDSHISKKQKNSSLGGRADESLDSWPKLTYSTLHSSADTQNQNYVSKEKIKAINSHRKQGEKFRSIPNLNTSSAKVLHENASMSDGTSNGKTSTKIVAGFNSDSSDKTDSASTTQLQNPENRKSLQPPEKLLFTAPADFSKLANSPANDYYMAVNFSEINLSQLDMSCMKNNSNNIDNIFLPAPQIARGSVDTYRRRHNSEEPFNSYLEALYTCEDGHHFQIRVAHSLYCLQEKWIGLLPNCIPANSTINGLDFDDDDPKLGTRLSCNINKGGCEHICEEKNDQIICSCYRGYRLKDERSCIDVNECETDNAGCQNQCWNIPGSFMCYCPEGYGLGSNRKSCLDKNECLLNNGHGPCQDVCTNTEGGYLCACSIKGTQLSADNHTCEDIDECTTNNYGCSQSCLNTVGSAFCTCHEGYMLGEDWKTCEDIDECQFPELAQSCRGDCINTIGSYKCGRHGEAGEDDLESDKTPDPDENEKVDIVCDPGYTKDDKEECIDVDECAMDNFGCSHICENTPGSASCTCPQGYNLLEDWQTCEDVDECTNGDLTCSHGCNNVNGSAHCTCPTGFELLADERTCEDINECSTDNGGCNQDCINTPGSYRCTCNGLYQLLPDEKTCRVAFCMSPSIPHDGELICNTSPDRGRFYIIHTSCRIQCPPEMQLSGIETITCTEDGQWDSYDYDCSVMQLCPPITKPIHGDVMPDSCLAHSKAGGEYCYFSCHKGYSLKGNPQRVCKHNQWEPTEVPQCIQDMEELRLACPPPVTVDLPLNQRRAFVRIPKPQSNVDLQHIRVYPSWISNYEASFPMGTIQVTYQAIQPITNRTISCSFSVTVQDRQPPIVFNCPQPITDVIIIGDKHSAAVTWKEPIFKDNVGITYVWKSKEPGSNLPPGIHHIRYIARDAAGNTAHCGFTFRIIKRMNSIPAPTSFSSRNSPPFSLRLGQKHGCSKQMNKLQNELLQAIHSAMKSGCPLEQHKFFAALKKGMLPPTAQLSVHSVPQFSKPVVNKGHMV